MDDIRVIEAGKVVDEIAMKQARKNLEKLQKKQKRDEALAMLMMMLAVPAIYLMFWLIG